MIKKDKFFYGLAFALVAVLMSGCEVNVPSSSQYFPDVNLSGEKNTDNGNKAKFDIYVMSQCPYGTQVEDILEPVMKKMGDVVDLNINYILSSKDYYKGKEAEFCVEGLCSMHGVPEVKGDIVQLCAASQAPEKALDFVACQNENAQEIPQNWEGCAQKLGLDETKLKACYEGEEGIKLLTENKTLADEVGATGSPTIFLNDVQQQLPREEVAFERAICQAIENQHKECANLVVCSNDADCLAKDDKVGKCVNSGQKNAECEYSDPVKIELTVLTDQRCQMPECDPAGVIEQIQMAFKGVKVLPEVDYTSEEGKALYESTGVQYLPAFLFDKSVTDAYFYDQVQTFLTERGDYFELATGSKFDPTKEVCDNGIDDTANDLIDCADPDCQNSLLCREEKKNQLDLFVMSQCPYGVKALNAMPAVLEAFQGELNFNIHYIASETESGKFNSLHGQPEVDEDIRELCVMKYYADNYQYMNYITCRNENISSTDWESCVTDSAMDLDKIKTCSTGDEGIALLSENIKMAQDLDIGASPTWLSNNKRTFSGLDPQLIQSEMCKDNPSLKGCSVDLSGVDTGEDVPAGSCG